jgi:hypothetical protein
MVYMLSPDHKPDLVQKMDLKSENFMQENSPETKNDLLHATCVSDC